MRSNIVTVVGVGYWGKNLARNFHALGALDGICDSDRGRLAEMAALYPGCRTEDRFDEVLRDKSAAAVVIATPAETHGKLVKLALASGKDVFVEKPLCLSVGEAEEILAAAKSTGRILMVGHLLWYHPAVLKLKELVDSGSLGRVRYVYSNRLNLGRIRREENILWSFAPHDISVILGLLGEMPDHVLTHGGHYLRKGTADVTVSLLSFPGGVKAHIFVSWLHPFKEQKLVVVGSEGMAVFDDMQPEKKLVVYSHKIDMSGEIPTVTKADGRTVSVSMDEPLAAECRHFIECLRTRGKPRTDGEEGLRVLKVLARCQEGLESSQE